jgi:hypothetical protein
MKALRLSLWRVSQEWIPCGTPNRSANDPVADALVLKFGKNFMWERVQADALPKPPDIQVNSELVEFRLSVAPFRLPVFQFKPER